MCIESQSMAVAEERRAPPRGRKTKRIVGNLGVPGRCDDSSTRARVLDLSKPERWLFEVFFANSIRIGRSRTRGRDDGDEPVLRTAHRVREVSGRRTASRTCSWRDCASAREPVPIPRARPDPEGTPARRTRRAARTRTPPPASRAPLTFFRIPFSPTSRSCCALGSPAAARTRRAHRGDGTAFATERELKDEIGQRDGVVRSGHEGGGATSREMVQKRAGRGPRGPRQGKAERL